MEKPSVVLVRLFYIQILSNIFIGFYIKNSKKFGVCWILILFLAYAVEDIKKVYKSL